MNNAIEHDGNTLVIPETTDFCINFKDTNTYGYYRSTDKLEYRILDKWVESDYTSLFELMTSELTEIIWESEEYKQRRLETEQFFEALEQQPHVDLPDFPSTNQTYENGMALINECHKLQAQSEIGQKFDSAKPRFSLLPEHTLSPILRVLEFGARKYAPNNWKHVENARERYYDAAMRHLYAWFNGESKDPETNESHLSHAICCLMFLLWFEQQQ